PPSSHFLQYFPLVIDSFIYGIYSVLFFQSVQILITRRCANYKLHLGCMVILFFLSTVHVIIAWAWAFITDTATTAIYEVFSLENPQPALYGPDDPFFVHHFAPLIKATYTIAITVADGILIYRCYVIWGHSWRVVSVPAVAYFCTIIGGIVGILPFSGEAERASVAVCLGMTFFTNVLAASLAAGRIWWICRRAFFLLNRDSRRKYSGLTASLLESGLIYPASLLITIIVFFATVSPVSVLICMAALYHIVGIAPTLIIVRVGLGVSADDVEKCITISQPTVTDLRIAAQDTMTLELGARRVSMDLMQQTDNTRTLASV
ncbi:hypothetical protein GGX14DRAFT_655258, partial [Mycena pura]